jgi:hypothetical protein
LRPTQARACAALLVAGLVPIFVRRVAGDQLINQS